ncbi:MAG: cytochrome c, partial [Thiothrix sp.]|nr:cytochrome c [Thiothrix sp.]
MRILNGLSMMLCLLLLGGCFKETRWYTEAQVKSGKPLFENNCMSCHGVAAAGLGTDWQTQLPGLPARPPALNGSAHVWHHPMKLLLYTIDQGGAPLGGSMPAFG